MQDSAFRDDVSQVTLGLTMLRLLVYATLRGSALQQGNIALMFLNAILQGSLLDSL